MKSLDELCTPQDRQGWVNKLQSQIVNEPVPQRKAALGQAIGQLMSNLKGMTRREAKDFVIQTILGLKGI